MERPGPLRWLRYAAGGALPARYNAWVLHDTTCATWVLRHLARAVAVLALPSAALLLFLPGASRVAESVPAVIAGSLARLPAPGHWLIDVAAIAASLWAMRLAARPAAGRMTFGLKRAEILSAAGNGITLLVVSGIVTFE